MVDVIAAPWWPRKRERAVWKVEVIVVGSKVGTADGDEGFVEERWR